MDMQTPYIVCKMPFDGPSILVDKRDGTNAGLTAKMAASLIRNTDTVALVLALMRPCGPLGHQLPLVGKIDAIRVLRAVYDLRLAEAKELYEVIAALPDTVRDAMQAASLKPEHADYRLAYLRIDPVSGEPIDDPVAADAAMTEHVGHVADDYEHPMHKSPSTFDPR